MEQSITEEVNCDTQIKINGFQQLLTRVQADAHSR